MKNSREITKLAMPVARFPTLMTTLGAQEDTASVSHVRSLWIRLRIYSSSSVEVMEVLRAK